MPTASIGQKKGPNSSVQCPIAYRTTNASKVDQIGVQSVASSIFTWFFFANDYHFFNHLDQYLFAEKVLPQPAGGRKCFLRVHWISDFYATGINKLISSWQNMLIVTVPILINKDVFEPSDNDLKFSLKPQFYLYQLNRKSLSTSGLDIYHLI